MASVGRRAVRVAGRTGRVAASVGALLLIAGMAACSAEDAEEAGTGPYAAEFAQARQNAVTDFQREVLSDDQITDAEFREVRQRYVDCLSGAGMKATALPDGSYEFELAPTGEQEAAERRCSDETTYVIEPLYYLVQVNPDNEDFSALIVECLRQQGVVDDVFTKEDWDRFVNAFAAQFNASSGAATGDATVPPADLPTLPGGVAMDDARVQQCSSNPLAL